MSKRVGVYGGMFDPVHCGHLAVATLAADALNLNRVLLVPCKQPNHRNAASASGAQRLEMLTLACADRAQLEASSIELEREGISFSVDTLAQLREEQPDTAFVFILGRDAFENLPRWERWQQLLDENLLAVVSRPSVAISRESAEVTKLAERQVSSPEALFNAVAGKVILLDELQSHLSSTLVRSALGKGELNRHEGEERWLPPGVHAFIEAHNLYRSNEN